MSINTTTDCRSDVGKTVGLIDAIQSIIRVLYESERPWTDTAVQEAVRDLHEDCDFQILCAAGIRDSCWVPVSERLPDAFGEYLVFVPGMLPPVSSSWYRPGHGFYAGLPEVYGRSVTHWRLMPEPPAVAQPKTD